METSIPVSREPLDFMALGGPTTHKQQMKVVHPMQQFQLEGAKTAQQNQKVMMGKVFGTHLPMQLKMEEAILCQFQRFPGLRSSLTGLETLMGTDTKMEFADYLGDPDFRTDRRDVFACMEARLGDAPLTRFT